MVATYVDHTLEARCAAHRMTVRWKYDESGLRVTSIRFAGASGARNELIKINSWLTGLPGDALVRVECGFDGAVLAFIDAQSAGSHGAKQVKISWLSNKAALIRRYNM
ncbi:hypothetical protein [Sphingomonas sp. Leaf412]|uniref:hypothetical protein n=1 Tax=Sphingomonas sp. Leaf412 TaxID=1736370 RepID=UPI0012E3F638|nr:hypothetical protein [Sphingomonas sp. Leaf412]